MVEKRKALAKKVQELEGKLGEAEASRGQAQQLERQCSHLQAAHSNLKRQLSTSHAQAERSQAVSEQAAQLERVRPWLSNLLNACHMGLPTLLLAGMPLKLVCFKTLEQQRVAKLWWLALQSSVDLIPRVSISALELSLTQS